MFIRSEGVHIRPQNIIAVDVPNKQGKVGYQFYYIAEKEVANGSPEYLAFRLRRDSKGRFTLAIDINTHLPRAIILKHGFGEENTCLVSSKIKDASLAPGTHSAILRASNNEAIDAVSTFRSQHHQDNIPIRGNRFGDGCFLHKGRFQRASGMTASGEGDPSRATFADLGFGQKKDDSGPEALPV